MGGRFDFNTAIAAVMELVNDCYRLRESAATGRAALRAGDGRLADLPVRPARRRGRLRPLTGRRVWEQPWPAADPALLETDTFELVCQVNGKVRDRVEAPADRDAGRAEVAVPRGAERIRAQLDGHEVVKEIVVPGKLVNLVVR